MQTYPFGVATSAGPIGPPERRAAGELSGWLLATHAVMAGTADADVPCDGCTACCESSQFVRIEPDEFDALGHIPAELLFPAPGQPGHLLMGYDEQGRCPMLTTSGCSIYVHRPRTCRAFDCRVFAATDVQPDDDKPLVVAAAAAWDFDVSTEQAMSEQRALVAAAEFVSRNRGADVLRAAGNAQLGVAAVAIQICDVFQADPARPDAEVLDELRSRGGIQA